MFVKPADRTVEGMPLVVRDPDLKDLLPAEGREVPDSLYWVRRLNDGDVVLADPPVDGMHDVVARAVGLPAEQVARDFSEAQYGSPSAE